MKFISTRDTDTPVTLREAVMKGLASDGGLFMPREIPVLPKNWWNNLSGMDDHSIAAGLLQPYLQDSFTQQEIFDICRESLTFPTPLRQLDEHTWLLELFHGPTLAFKDVGARFLANVMERLLAEKNEKITILTATSGDTGSAVAQAFYGSDFVDVVVLYPSGKISRVQEQQIATLGKNIAALEVRGNFDDCQRMVKEAFNNREIRQQLQLTSANSINIMRLLPQMIYYALAVRDLSRSANTPVFSVPSGNFGNLTAGLIAHRMGMPAEYFIAACNANHVFPDFLETGSYTPHPSLATLSNAMDVGDPSNFERMRFLFGDEVSSFRDNLRSRSYNDEHILRAITEVYQKYQYIADPHTAVGWLAWQDFRTASEPSPGIILSTAHPAKFGDTVIQAIGQEPEIPERLARNLDQDKLSVTIDSQSEALFDYLRQK